MEPDENGLFSCNKCNGEGKFLVPGKQIDKYTYMAVFKICDKCDGDGKLDWIGMAMGKKKENLSHEDELEGSFEDDFTTKNDVKNFKPKKAPKR